MNNSANATEGLRVYRKSNAIPKTFLHLYLRQHLSVFSLQALPFIIEGIRILPMVTFPLVYFAGGDEKWVAIGVLIFFILLLLLAVISTFKTGDENPGFLEKVTR